MKGPLVLALLLFSSAAIVAVTPAYATSPIPSCTRTLQENGFTYTVTLSPCPSNSVGSITMTGSTNNPAISQVEFIVSDPTNTANTYSVTTSTSLGGYNYFSTSFSAGVVGTYYVHAAFCTSTGACFASANDLISDTVQILVLNAVPLGAVAVTMISLAGLVVYQRANRKPLSA
jgi:hypothetical protein